MRAHVVFDIGELVELFVADFALHLLILATGLLIDYLHSPPQLLLFPDCLAFETCHLGTGMIMVNSHIFCSGC